MVEQNSDGISSVAPKKNVSVTFRLDGCMVERLKKEASEKVISLNMLVRQVIKQHIDWHFMAPKAGFIPVRKELVIGLLSKMTDEEIKLLAKQIASTTNKDTLMLLKNRISIESALEIIDSWLKSCEIPYRYQATPNNRHNFIIQHDMGQKWSIYLGELYRHMFETCNARDYTYEARDNTLMLVIEAH